MTIPEGFRERTPVDDIHDRLRELERKLGVIGETAILTFAFLAGCATCAVLQLVPQFRGTWFQAAVSVAFGIGVGVSAYRYLTSKFRTGFGHF